jgi:N-acetylmuramoyl-L-alanine amidase
MSNQFYKIVFSIIILIASAGFYQKSATQDKINRSEKKIETIVIDAGHGGKDPGTIGFSGVFEKNIVLPIAKKVKDLLITEYDDVKVILTRDSDDFIEVRNRGKIANDSGANLFVSIHCNFKKSEENDKKGFEIYVLDLARIPEAFKVSLEENNLLNIFKQKTDTSVQKFILTSLAQNGIFHNSTRFASILQYTFATGTKLESRGVNQAGYYVLLGASMPSILIECGYLSNKSDEDYLRSDKGQSDIAKSIYKAIRFYKFDYEFESENY